MGGGNTTGNGAWRCLRDGMSGPVGTRGQAPLLLPARLGHPTPCPLTRASSSPNTSCGRLPSVPEVNRKWATCGAGKGEGSQVSARWHRESGRCGPGAPASKRNGNPVKPWLHQQQCALLAPPPSGNRVHFWQPPTSM